MDRRQLLAHIAAAATAALWSGDTLATQMAKAVAARDATHPPDARPTRPMTALQRVTLAALTDLIIPTTDTPGAVEAGVPAFVDAMFMHWMNDGERVQFAQGLDALDSDAQARYAKSFAQCDSAQKTATFAATSAATKGYQPTGFGLAARIADPLSPFFFKARDLTTLGYFTSEQGITKELAYVPVPGRFDGDIDIKTWNKQMQL